MVSGLNGRPTNLDEMIARLERLGTEESTRRGRAFQPQSTDVFISPYAKSGTTWLQQIVHGLRTRGDMDFDEITSVVPWVERAHDLGLDLNSDQYGGLRAFKTHSNWDDIPKGGKYICSIRNPKDVVVSFYHFFEGWFFEKGSISLDEFALDFFIDRDPERSYWHHLVSWWQQGENPDVLLMSFEEMRKNLPQTIKTVAKFVDIELDEELFKVVKKQSSLEFMKANGEKFDDHLMRELSEKQSGLPPGGESSKVRQGRVGDHRVELSQAVSERMDAIWQAVVTPRLGFKSYEELQEQLAFGKGR